MKSCQPKTLNLKAGLKLTNKYNDDLAAKIRKINFDTNQLIMEKEDQSSKIMLLDK